MNPNRDIIFKKIDNLDNVIYVLEATANYHYCPNDKMWNHLLKARDSIQKHINKEKILLYKLIDKIDSKFIKSANLTARDSAMEVEDVK